MTSISDRVIDAARVSAAAHVAEPSKIRRAEEDAFDHSLKSAEDTYTPEEKAEPIGRYWPERDESGRLEIRFDDPKQPEKRLSNPEEAQKVEKSNQNAGGDGADKSIPGRKEEICRGNTDEVDREIEKLKKKKEDLERQLNSETDEKRIRELERKLAQIEQELGQKDNDTYRRNHTVFS